MQAFLTSLSILSLALGSVSAAPTSSGKINCQTTPYRTSTISATLQTGYSSNTTTYYGLENVEATNHNGVKSKVLISTKDDGSAFTAEDATKFNFYLCESTYLDTHFDGKWGIVKPVDNEANCIQTKTGSIEEEGVMVSAPCSYEEDSSQLQQSFQHNGHSITFTSHRIGLGQHQHPTHFTRSEVNHHAMKLVPGAGQSQFYNGSKDFAFLNFPDPSKDDA